MTFIYIALAAQLLSAIVVLADKYLVTSNKAIQKPIVYTFYVAMLSGVVVVLLPFGVILPPNFTIIALSLAITAVFIPSLFFLYKSLKTADASDVAPIMGAVSAVSAAIFSYFILSVGLTGNFFNGFVLLVAGTVFMSYFRFKGWSGMYTVLAGVLFGLSAVLFKVLFNETTFVDGFFWSRMANVAGALALLLWPPTRSVPCF